MSKILNRRNALLGWAVWTIVRLQAKRKAKRAVHLEGEPRRGKAFALAVAVLGALGLVFVWRKLRGDEGEQWTAPEPPAAAEPTTLASMPGDDDIPPAA